MKKRQTTGYKVTNPDLSCNGYQFKLKTIHTQTGTLKICANGFHFCTELNDCFNYYNFDPNNRVFEVIAYGDLDTNGDKSCALEIKLVKELSWIEVLKLVNTGSGNSGRMNAGNDNAGYYNAGNYNAGNRNAGNRNAGNYNAGYYNAGNRNAGNDNAGNYNAGNRNAGNYNAGNRNAGNRNAGNYNAGNRNAGYSNAGNDNAGAFNNLQANYMLFNKPSDWTYEQFINSNAFSYLEQVNANLWVPDYKMTDAEKLEYPYYVTTGGFNRTIPYKEAFANSWNNWSDNAKQSFKDLPNFDAAIFEDITGIAV
jgi:hypothetical protein